MILDYLVGSDIEVFLKEGNEIISAEGYIEGTKEKPFELDRKGCAVSLDNILMEFNVNPTKDYEEMWEDIIFNLNFIHNSLPDGMDIAIQSSAILDAKWLQTDNAKLLGCEPDYSVYTRAMNIAPNTEGLLSRSAGGHIHIGSPILINNFELIEKVAKAFDLFLGVPSLILDPDTERRKLYGKAGCVRFCEKYGFEYRTLSNFWIKNKELVKWVFQNVDRAIQFVNNNEELPDEQLIINTINNNDTATAKELINQYKLLETYVVA